TEPPTPPMEGRAFRVFWMLSVGPTPPEAATLEAKAPVEKPLKVSVKVPVIAPPAVTVCTSEVLRPPSAAALRMFRTPWLPNVAPVYVLALGSTTLPEPTLVRSPTG